MLDIRSLRVAYRDQIVLDDLDLSIGTDGSVVTALLGPSGCGKSTLIRAITGIERPSAGVISFDGVDLADVPTHRRDFGVVFQDGQLLPGRTVSANIGYGLRARRWSRSATAQRVDELLDLVGLPGLEDRPVSELSGGQAQRVALARALAPNPRLLLLDEPLSSLDRRLRERLAVDIAEILRAAGTPTILVTHDHQEAAVLADRIAIMSQGSIVQSGTPDALWRTPTDEWVARFVGCTSIVTARMDGDVAVTAVGRVTLPDRDAAETATQRQLGLRPRSLVVTSTSAVLARVESVAALPEEYLLQIRLPSGAQYAAVSDRAVSVGDEVAVALDPDRIAVIG
ncbi:ABC transporter ATP-binding protein [Williamsia phyllosphaerae]|uniref:ABC transporter n=1 Tax=Williamsia phyllosphaerae TaxID=885042 RepID=A0ABQ1UVV3_9NOCA|nr:ABC transporter ATP-binding protein [Williamsia phyllosphaerae]GGF26754.1 ABC transporter [Williamsia phyllosphaerae]